MTGWQRRRILIWGKTRPELSKTYREVVCTGGVFADTKKLVRLYPVPLRYMDDEQVFRKYQWIEANVQKASKDARPESYRIAEQGIQVGELIPPKNGDWDARAAWILGDPSNTFESVEHLEAQQQRDLTSLGLVAPARIDGIRHQRVSSNEQHEFWTRYADAVSQMDLPLDPDTGREIKPLRPPDYHFKIDFHCAGTCRGHSCKVLDWEMDALYFNLLQRGDDRHVAARKVVEKLESICAPSQDLRFFMGNIANHPTKFTIVGTWWPKKPAEKPQLELFSRPSKS